MPLPILSTDHHKNCRPKGSNDNRSSSLVLFCTAREDSSLSIERLHKKNVYVPRNEDRHKDLPQKPRYVIQRHNDVSTQKDSQG